MSNACPSCFKWSIISFALLALAAFCIPVRAQEATEPAAPNAGFVDDWTHHHLVFSNPGTRDDAVKSGKLEKWQKVTNDPRYQLQQAKRTFGTRPVIADPDLDFGTGSSLGRNPVPPVKTPPLNIFGDGVKKDWSTNLGSGTAAIATGTFTSGISSGTSLEIVGGGNTLTLTAATTGTGICTGSGTTYSGSFTRSSAANTDAVSLASLINASSCSSRVGVTASAPGSGVLKLTAATGTAGNSIKLTENFGSSFNPTWSSTALTGGTTATVQPNAYPAKYGISPTTAYCASATTPDFVVYPTGQVGASTAANIIAYDNLYSGCTTGSVPSVYWAFNTGTGYAVTTSPVLSLDGTKVAFIQSNGTGSDLVVVKWKPSNGTLTAPVAPSLASNITTCTTPCMTVTALSHNDTYSSPYYDNGSDDALYVGDDSGYLEKFTGVFNGTVVTTVTPIELNTTTQYPLASPVYDGVSGCVFVGDTEGYLYSVSSGVAGSVCTGATFARFGHSENLGSGGANEGIFDGPLVDPVAETVYVFVADSGDISLTTTLNVTSNPPYFNTFTVTPPGVLTQADVGATLSYDGFPDVATIISVALNGESGTLNNDSTAGTVCAFIILFGGNCNGVTFTLSDTSISPGDNVVDEFLASTITSGSTTATPVQAEPLGTGGAGYNIYSGAFDNVYYSSTTAATANGNLYALGNTGTTAGATLYQIPIAYGSIAGVNPAVTGLSTAEYPWPSPVTEFCNNGTSACASNGTSTTSGKDYLFFSVNRGNKTGCTTTAGSGCILSYNISNPASVFEAGSGLSVATPGTNGCWATGGLVIDNSASGTAGAQQIYFVNLNGATAGGVDGTTPASSNCTAGTGPTINAVQASQSSP